MFNNKLQPRSQWSSYSSYILVTTGAIVGLGNIFNFPLFVAKFGGLFFLLYILSEIVICLPLLFAELIIGRRGKQNPVGAISIIAMESGASHYWRKIGWLCFIILFLTLSLYTVSVAYPLSYFVHSISAVFHFEATDIIDQFIPLEICFLVFLVATLLVIVRGINRGLEEISWLTVPFYFFILFILAVYASMNGNFLAAVNHLFQIPDGVQVWPVLFIALTFAFFKLNIGMGSLMVYGSYMPYDLPLIKSTITILILDAIASLLSYFILAPLMFQATGLVVVEEAFSYQTIMMAFSSVPGGILMSSLFFLAAIVAAWTATIAMAESAAVILIERLGLARMTAVIWLGVGAILIGTLAVLSHTLWPHVIFFDTWTLTGLIKNVASDIAEPLSAFLIAIFCGWIARREIMRNELFFNSFFYMMWHFLMRYFIPVCMIIIVIGVGFN